MASNVLATAAVSVVSLLSGVAVTLWFNVEVLDLAIPGAATDPYAGVVVELGKTQARLARIEKSLDEGVSSIRRDVRASQSEGSGDPPVVPGRARAAAPPPGEEAPSAAHFSREAGTALRSPSHEALRPLAAWAEDPVLRSRWLFATEKSSLDAFGTPDEVETRGPTEWWSYWNLEGDVIPSEYRVKMNNGRLVEASLVKWEKPRRRPRAGE